MPPRTLSVLYDGSVFAQRGGARGGVGRYWCRLLETLAPGLAARVSTRPHGALPATGAAVNWPWFPRFRPHRLGQACEEALARRQHARAPFDLLHPTYYGFGNLTWELKQRGQPLVLTVFDLIQEKVIGPGDPLIASGGKRRAIQAADLCVCISRSTADDLREIHDVPPARIRVIYPGNDLSFPGPSEQPADPPRFLVVGQRSGYKNFAATLAAFAALAPRWPDAELHLVGPPISAEEGARLAELRLAARVHSLGRLSDTALAGAYARSVALVYPSRIEGFGLPVIEAMACGTAVITSNVSSMAEIAGGHALLVDPAQPAEIEAAMERLLREPALRARLVEAGRLHAAKFRWDECARQLAEAYRELAD